MRKIDRKLKKGLMEKITMEMNDLKKERNKFAELEEEWRKKEIN